MNRKEWMEFKKRNNEKIETTKTIKTPEVKTKKVFAGMYKIVVNGKEVGVAERTTNGWAARANATTNINLRVFGRTKNAVVGKYATEYLAGCINGKAIVLFK